MAKTQNIEQQLRKAIKEAERRGVTRYQISKISGVSQALLGAFVNDPKRHIRADVAERIAAAIDRPLLLTGGD